MSKAKQFMNEVVDAGLAGAQRLENGIGKAYGSVSTTVSQGINNLRRINEGPMFNTSLRDNASNLWKGIKLHPYRNAGIAAGAVGAGLYTVSD